jgi:GC-rich sequence DNA-binding factor
MVYHNYIVELTTSVQQAASPSAVPAPAFDPASRTSMERFVRRRLKLIKNILLWRRQSPNEARELITRIVNDVLRPVLERAWDGGGREMALRVSVSLPPEILRSCPGHRGGRSYDPARSRQFTTYRTYTAAILAMHGLPWCHMKPNNFP